MKQFIKQVATVLTVFTFLFVSSSTIFAVNYGEGSYDVGIYNVGEVPSPAPTSSPQASSNDAVATSAPTTPTCTTPRPSGAPDLFQINSTASTGVTIYFAPVAGNSDRYYISYSTNSSAEEFGTEILSSADGVVALNIQSLKANTVYYFKVRAGNGCMPGDWSAILAAKTGQRLPTFRWKSLSMLVSNSVAGVKKQTPVQEVYQHTESSGVVSQPTSGNVAPAVKQPQPETSNATTNSPTLFQRIGSFFSSFFKR